MSKPMSQFLFKTVVARTSSMCPLQNPNVSSLRIIRWFSIGSKDDKRNSFVVSYLENSLGLSPKIALSISKSVKFESPDKPDKAIEFLRNFGFSQTQISKLVRGHPTVLTADIEKIILPKLEFLIAKGVLVPEMTKMLSSFPSFLRSSLSDQIMPSYDYLLSLFQSEERAVDAVKRYPDILCYAVNYVVANAGVLRQHGVTDSKIASWLERSPRSFVFRLDRFREAVEGVANMGFNASRSSFSVAVKVCLGLSKSTWESKVGTFRKCGFSEEEIFRVFRWHPYSMAYSEVKILATMDFLVEEMSFRPSLIASSPEVLGMSLKKRIIPRCSVYKVLLSKGLVRKQKNDKHNLRALLSGSEERFLENYAKPYANHAPELLELYEEKLNSLLMTH